MIPVFVKKWEEGHRIVSAVKSTSKENGFIRFLRTVYYRMIRKMSTVKMIEHFTGFGLYDKTFISLLRELDDPIPFVRGIVAEYGAGFNMIQVEYEQPKRRAGKTHNNFYTLYDAAMLSITSYTKIALRLATFFGLFCSFVSIVIALVYLVMNSLTGTDLKQVLRLSSLVYSSLAVCRSSSSVLSANTSLTSTRV